VIGGFRVIVVDLGFKQVAQDVQGIRSALLLSQELQEAGDDCRA